MASDPTLDELADELYALPPDRFIATRDERVRAARAAGDRGLAARLGELRRPTTSAWVLNLLVRDQPELLDQLLGLGEELRRAQHELRGPALRELAGQRQRVVAELVRAARRRAADAGHPVTAETGYEVEQTLHAALADPDAARLVCTGRLVRPVEHSGFGGDSPVAGATPSAGQSAAGRSQPARAGAGGVGTADRDRPPAEPAGTRRRRGAATADAQRADWAQAERERAEQQEAKRRADRERLLAQRDAAQADLDRAEGDLQATEDRLAATEQARDDAAALVATLEEQLNAARRTHRDSGSQIRDARHRRDAAAKIRDGAARRLTDTTTRLEAHPG